MKAHIATLALSALVLLSAACKKENLSEGTKEGSADITLTLTNGEKVHIKGPCGWAVAMDVPYIGANHADNNLLIFHCSFNISAPPSSTTTYTLVADNQDTDPAHAWINVTLVKNGSIIGWSSTDASGSVTLNVTGKKVTVNLNGIGLKASDGFNANPAPYDAAGALSGSLEFYRE